MYTSTIITTIQLNKPIHIITYQTSTYTPTEPLKTTNTIHQLSINLTNLPHHIQIKTIKSKQNNRPNMTETSIIISKNQTIKNNNNFEQLINKLTNTLKKTTNNNQILIDTKIAPNELQIKQTKKIVTPKIYLTLNISKTIQHITNMKNSKTIITINNNPNAPIFKITNINLIKNVYKIIPQLIEQLNQKNSK